MMFRIVPLVRFSGYQPGISWMVRCCINSATGT